MQRRTFLKWSLQASTLTMLTMTGWGCSRDGHDTDRPIRLPPLPYALEALEPYLSAETLRFHYDKHHSPVLCPVAPAFIVHGRF